MSQTEISFNQFQKLDLRVGRITGAERIPDSDRLVKLQVDLGPAADSDESPTRNVCRQLVAGLAEAYPVDALVGRQIIVLVNLAPKSFLGEVSQGMLLAADVDGKPVLIVPGEEVPEGSVVR